mmetsp:Transcript_14273/g.32456  ORF Transcript_14273/g.32456 Transcript_14273/m.32456 type:complete len:161 (-) Transcript_14273:158-640(-)
MTLEKAQLPWVPWHLAPAKPRQVHSAVLVTPKPVDPEGSLALAMQAEAWNVRETGRRPQWLTKTPHPCLQAVATLRHGLACPAAASVVAMATACSGAAGSGTAATPSGGRPLAKWQVPPQDPWALAVREIGQEHFDILGSVGQPVAVESVPSLARAYAPL